MYRVVIIEDEPLARQKLVRMASELSAEIQIIAEFTSVAEVVNWLDSKATADVIFSDIELTDGNVFEAYTQQSPPCPIIFTTAYDAFLLPAFETHGIAYLLKPYNQAKLENAWQKFLAIAKAPENPMAQLEKLLSLATQQHTPKSPARFAIKQQQQTYFLNVADIMYVKAEGSIIMAFDQENKRHYLPVPSLQAAENELSSEEFFRINRSELVRGSAVDKLERFNKNTLAVYLKNGVQLKTSESRTAEFGRWLGVS